MTVVEPLSAGVITMDLSFFKSVSAFLSSRVRLGLGFRLSRKEGSVALERSWLM